MRPMQHMAVVAAAAMGLSGCWLQPGFTEGRTNYAAGEQVLTPVTAGELAEVWRTHAGDTPAGPALNVRAPVAIGGDIYAAYDDGGAAALDAATGSLRWQTFLSPEADAPPSVGDPVVDGDELVVPVTTVDRIAIFDSLHRISRATGEPTRTTGGTGDLALVDGDMVPMSVARTYDSSGITELTRIEWTYRPTVFSFNGNPAPGGHAFVGERVLWSQAGNATGYSSACPPPTFPPGVEWPAGACGPDWTTPLATRLLGPAAVGSDAAVYADPDGGVHVLDAATGEVRWQADLGGAVSRPPAVAGDTILVATSDGRLVALPADGCGTATCAPLWEGTVGGAATTAPVAAGDVAYVATDAGTIVAFDLGGCGTATCAPLVTLPTGSDVSGGPIVHDGRLIAGLANGEVVAFGLG
jgi:outer membrane protein assembly factor BamB